MILASQATSSDLTWPDVGGLLVIALTVLGLAYLGLRHRG